MVPPELAVDVEVADAAEVIIEEELPLEDPLLVVPEEDEVEEEEAPDDAPETALPGRLTVDLAARAWKLARERVAFAAVLDGSVSLFFFLTRYLEGRVDEVR